MSVHEPMYNRISPSSIIKLAAPQSWLPASIIPVLFAVILSMGAGHFSVLMFYALLVSAVLMHSAANAINDHYDFIRRIDTLENTPENDDAVLVHGNYKPSTTRFIGISFLLLSLAIGMVIVCFSNFIPLVIGFIGAVTVVLYSVGPKPLSYMPLGEFTSGVVMGILLPIAVYAALTGEMNWSLIYLCLPFVLGISSIMLTNNTCDIERDLASGRKTLPCFIGRSASRYVLRSFLVVWLIALVFNSVMHFPLGLFVLPLGIVFGFGCIKRLILSDFSPASRGYRLSDVFQTNVLINGSYLLCALVGLWR